MRWIFVISLSLIGACRGGCDPRAANEEVMQAQATCLSAVVVSVQYPGASPSEVEAGIVTAVEEAVAGIPSVKSVLSRAREGRGLVFVETDKNADELLDRVKDAVDGIISFPAGAERPIVFAPTTNGSYLVVVDDAEALASADSILGAPLRTIEIRADESKMRAFDLDLDALASALRHNSVGLGPGRIAELGEVVVRLTPTDQPIYVRDVAAIVDAGAPLPQAYRGERRVVVGDFIVRGEGERPSLPGQLEVFGPAGCGSGPPARVSVTAMLPPGTQPTELTEIGQRVAIESSKVESRAVTIVGDAALGALGPAAGTRIEVLAPAGDDPDAVAARLADVLRQTPSLAVVDVSGVPSSIELDVVHDDHEARRLAVQAMLEAVGSTVGVFVAAPSGDGAPELRLELSDRGRAVGLTTVDVALQVRKRMQGLEIARLQLGREEVPVRLRLSGASPMMQDISLRTPSGEMIAIRDVARIETRPGGGTITRRDRRRVTPVVVFGPNAARNVAEIIGAGEAAAAGVSVRRSN